MKDLDPFTDPGPDKDMYTDFDKKKILTYKLFFTHMRGHISPLNELTMVDNKQGIYLHFTI